MSDIEEEWIPVEHKRRQNQKLELQSHSSEQFKKTFPTNHVDASLTKESSDKNYSSSSCSNSTSKIDIQSLIGKPVIRFDAPIDIKFKSKPDQERRGGLLYINPSSTDDFPFKKQKTFDSQKEIWPMLDSIHSEDRCITEGSGMAWSSVVRAPPKQRVIIPKVSTDDSSIGEKDDVQMISEEETKNKKKKKKQKDKPSEPQTLDLGAMIEALKSSKSPKKKSHVSIAINNPVSKVQRFDTGAANPRNVLDSSAPSSRRGKEREAPKKKKLTPLRKTIIKERQERKKILEEGKPIPSILDVLNPSQIAATDSSKTPAPPPPPGLHNRRFRDYCTHLVTPELNNIVESLLSDLVRFQDRVYKNEPLKLRTKRRYVCGLREVTKNLELKRLKCIIIPPNLDKIQSPGGINQTVEKIIHDCEEQGILVVYSLSRKQLAYVLKKKFHIGCVGIISFAGAEDKFKKMIEVVNSASKEYTRKKNSLINNPSGHKPATIVVKPIPSEDTTGYGMEGTVQPLTEEESDDYEEEDDDEIEEESSPNVPVSDWSQLFPTSHQNSDKSLSQPVTTSTSLNVLAPPFVPNFN